MATLKPSKHFVFLNLCAVPHWLASPHQGLSGPVLLYLYCVAKKTKEKYSVLHSNYWCHRNVLFQSDCEKVLLLKWYETKLLNCFTLHFWFLSSFWPQFFRTKQHGMGSYGLNSRVFLRQMSGKAQSFVFPFVLQKSRPSVYSPRVGWSGGTCAKVIHHQTGSLSHRKSLTPELSHTGSLSHQK